MSEAMRSSDGLDDRRKKLLYRAWHRGMREMDYVLGSFANEAIADMSDAELDAFEMLMQLPDPDMYNGFRGLKLYRKIWTVPLFAVSVNFMIPMALRY